TLLLDGRCVPAATALKYKAALEKKGAALQSRDIVSPLWAEARPALPNTPCRLLTPAQTGATAAQRIELVRAELRKKEATALAVTGLDCVGWLLNLRASDLPCTPLAVAYALVTMDACTLFLAPGRLSEADAATLAESGVAVRGYDELAGAVQALGAGEVVLVDEANTNYDLYTALKAHKTVAGADPIRALKGVKNEVELANIRECHIRDGVAVVRFEMDLEKALSAGQTLHETDIEKMLQRRRREQPGCFDDSFGTIAAYGPNAAMMHYHAEGEVDSVIQRRGFLLVDNGGQYDCGTTDITRTYPVGPLTESERQYYTWVLQSHIDMARAVFLDYCTGFALDTFARAAVWRHKINYRCGTGHGVGFIASVHEGPQSLRPHNNVVFQPGMTITDEPGIYETDEVGIRIENELVCVDLGENQYGRWLGFEPLTMVPIATEPVLVDELSREQLDWLNDYHRLVYEALAPRLTAEEQAWLREKTRPLTR
ncbi:MAG: aminopeptidase family protein P, partial [Gemmiger sp.]